MNPFTLIVRHFRQIFIFCMGKKLIWWKVHYYFIFEMFSPCCHAVILDSRNNLWFKTDVSQDRAFLYSNQKHHRIIIMRQKSMFNKCLRDFLRSRKSEQKWDKLLTKTSQHDVIKASLIANSRKKDFLLLGMQIAWKQKELNLPPNYF